MKKKNLIKSNSAIALAVILAVLAVLGICRVPATAFQSALQAMCVAFRAPVTVFCYLCVLFLIFMVFSKSGSIRIGGPDARKEYSTFSWLSCLFMAGCGIGIVFYCNEPVLHYFDNPYTGNVAGSPEAVALSLSLFNWTINAWAQYGVLGLVLAYFYFNNGRRLKLSSVLPARTPGWILRGIDIIMALGVIAGLTTSLGLGVSQISGGISYVFGIDASPYLLMAVIGLISTWSIMSGLKRGVKWLSNITSLCVAVLLSVLVLVGIFGSGIVDFVPYMANGTGLLLRNYFEYNDFYNEATVGWAASYPIFFDLWFAAWAAFVAVFVAKISRGRTVREFIVGVVGFPILFTCLWFGIFGRLGLEYKELIYDTMSADVSTSVFIFLERVCGPAGYVLMAGLVLVIICLFFITSSDSGSYVVASLLSSDKEAGPREKMTWSLIQCAVAIVLFFFGGLALVQSVSVIMGIAVMVLILLGAIFFIYRITRSK